MFPLSEGAWMFEQLDMTWLLSLLSLKASLSLSLGSVQKSETTF